GWRAVETEGLAEAAAGDASRALGIAAATTSRDIAAIAAACSAVLKSEGDAIRCGGQSGARKASRAIMSSLPRKPLSIGGAIIWHPRRPLRGCPPCLSA